jgi:hypothetical protein
VTDPTPPDPNDPANRPEDPAAEKPSLLWKVVKSAIAPDVLEDGGQDAPLSARGRWLFWGVVAALVIAILILFAITLAQK